MEKKENRPTEKRYCKCLDRGQPKTAACLQVGKDGPNKGRYFFTCSNRVCKYFEWSVAMKATKPADRVPGVYDPKAFRKYACQTCGRLKHNTNECDFEFDILGNKIPAVD
jgi:hypothetical protein